MTDMPSDRRPCLACGSATMPSEAGGRFCSNVSCRFSWMVWDGRMTYWIHRIGEHFRECPEGCLFVARGSES